MKKYLWNKSAKVERIYLKEYDSISDLKMDIKDYIQFYNLGVLYMLFIKTQKGFYI
jgi:hypothetical protein